MLPGVELSMAKSEITSTQRMLNVWAIILIIWSFYRATFGTTLPAWIDEFVAKPLVFLFPLYWYSTRSKKIPFSEMIGFSKKHKIEDILFGIGIGAFFILMAVMVRYMKVGSVQMPVITGAMLLWVATSISAAFLEQIVSTGFIFNGLLKESKNIFQALIITAILFSFLHIPALFGASRINGGVLMQTMLLNVVLSLTTSIAFLLRKNTTVPAIIHALYLLSLPILL